VEREVLMTGIGGQGIQLASQVLARAALAEGNQVQLFGSYAGMMRGGSTETTLVIADGPVEAPPTVHRAWAVLVMHPEHAAGVLARLRPGGVVVVNTTLCKDPAGPADRGAVVEVAATELAVGVGHIMTASMVMIGALAAATGIVDLDSLVGALATSLPPYRTQHLALNDAALRAGFAAVTAPVGAQGAAVR